MSSANLVGKKYRLLSYPSKPEEEVAFKRMAANLIDRLPVYQVA